jgi:hypothetical protein
MHKASTCKPKHQDRSSLLVSPSSTNHKWSPPPRALLPPPPATAQRRLPSGHRLPRRRRGRCASRERSSASCARVRSQPLGRGAVTRRRTGQRVPQDKKKKTKANKARRSVWPPASIWPCSYATALRSACLRAQPFSDWSSHYNPSVRPVPASFPWQTGTGSLAAPLGGGGAGDGGRLLRLQPQDVREASQEEPADGIDLTLKL